MVVINNSPTKQSRRLEDHKAPPQFALVLHLNPKSGSLTLFQAVHVLNDHLGISQETSEDIVVKASRSGRAVIKPVSKDVGETLLASVNTCAMLKHSNQFKISLEQV